MTSLARTRRARVGVLLRSASRGLGVAILFAACSSPVGGAGSSPVATSMVDLPKSYRFAPTAIVVTAGTTVTWTNDDNFTHSVHFLDGGLPTQPLVMEPGTTQTYTFATPGTYRYECSFHPQDMQGSVVVKAP